MALSKITFIFILSGFILLESILAIQINGYLLNNASSDGIAEGDVLFKIFGEFREIISDALFIKADEYYHGGTKHPSAEDSCMLQKDKKLPEKEGCQNDAFTGIPQSANLFSRINYAIDYHPLIHLSGQKNKEVIPWFYLATRLDPHNVQAYAIGSYWLSAYLQKPEQALDFLKEGLKNNPESWVIYREIGDIYFLIKKDYVRAGKNFKLAYMFMNKKTTDVFEQRHVLTLLAAACEKTGDLRQAVYYYELLYKILQYDAQLRAKINLLKKGLGEN